MRSMCAPGDTDLTVGELAGLVFCSNLQPSERPTAQAVRSAVLRHLASENDPLGECAAHVAGCYGEDPDGTCERMRWARSVAISSFLRHDAAA